MNAKKSNKVPPPIAKQDFGRDMKEFMHQPVKVRESEILRDFAEKTVGPDHLAAEQLIRTQSAQETPGQP